MISHYKRLADERLHDEMSRLKLVVPGEIKPGHREEQLKMASRMAGFKEEDIELLPRSHAISRYFDLQE